MLNTVSISEEIHFPFTIIDICTMIIRFVFLPTYLENHLDVTSLEAKCSVVIIHSK